MSETWFFDPEFMKIVLYSFMGVVGVVGNVATCLVIATNKFMHTSTNCYLFNLAVSDLVILFGFFPVLNFLPTDNEIACKLRILIARTSVQAMVLTVSMVSIDRYIAICHPFVTSKHNLTSISRAMKSIVIIWLVGFIFAIPLALQYGLQPKTDDPSIMTCAYANKMNLHYVPGMQFIFFFLIPMLLIGILYLLIGLKLRESAKTIKSNNEPANRLKQQTPKMLMIVVAAFFVCWMPINLERNLVHYGVIRASFLYDVSQIMYYLSSIVNPIIYNIMSKKFRRAFKSTIFYCRADNLTNHTVLWSISGNSLKKKSYSLKINDSKS